MTDIGTYKGTKGLDKLYQEIRATLEYKGKAVVAIAGLPGSGKTYMVKRFVRLGFGAIGRKDILVIDDNTIYSTRFWRLKWKKIQIEKKQPGVFWIPTMQRLSFFQTGYRAASWSSRTYTSSCN